MRKILALGVFLVSSFCLCAALASAGYLSRGLLYNEASEKFSVEASEPIVQRSDPIPTEVVKNLPAENRPVVKVAPTVIAAPKSGKALPTPTKVVLPKIERIKIPSIRVDAQVVDVDQTQEADCVKKNGPKAAELCGWYYDTPAASMVGHHVGSGLPGEGRAIEFNGHVQWYKELGALVLLRRSEVGDQVILTTADGKDHLYLVRQRLIFPAETSQGLEYVRELERKYGELLSVTTCTTWDPKVQEYVNRLFIIAVPGTSNVP